ncbi:protein jag [Rossellomorea vietnamensis]|uniref:RNA-binding protein KhpB n=1 Tax=Rossellomorea vietnamensis TaxID=218284 RepID=A0A5D4KEV0_9BACI|nr:RNA-binding cell elongation regulator Jag/EloR [Rossellomorea vietnamensis]TYR74743.1 protein jag [Rossellomorea vietnamensis]
MREVTATGPSVEEAVESALAQLNISREQAEIEVKDEGKKGFFGLFGTRPATVFVKKINNPFDEVKKYLISVSNMMGIDVEIDIKVDGRHAEFQLAGEKIALLIGKRGQTLNSLQHLAGLVANRYSEQFLTVVLDAENYRERRRQTLASLAERLAEKAVRTNRKVSLEPMPSYERKVIHSALVRSKKVETFSEGSEPNRYIVIEPKRK